MSFTVTDSLSDLLNSRREGVNLLTKEQLAQETILRLRPNVSNVFVFNGRIVKDNFFDENLVDMDAEGSMSTAPSCVIENRTIGQESYSENVFTDIQDFDPVTYLEDVGLALYPVVLTSLGFEDPSVDNGTFGIFETRKEMMGISKVPHYAKKGPKAAFGNSSESSGKHSYVIEQLKLRDYSLDKSKFEQYIEAAPDDMSLLTTYADQDPTSIIAFEDTNDSNVASNGISDPDIASIIASSVIGSTKIITDKISSTAGWTYLNTSEGIDSIVYGDRT